MKARAKYEPPVDVYIIKPGDRMKPKQRNALNLEILSMIKSIDAWWLHASGGECGGDRMPESMRRARRDAMGRLAVVNDPLVINIAGAYFKLGGNRLAFDDALQAGRMGLMRAADLFSFEYKTQFSTYATWWVRQSVLNEINKNSHMVRIPIGRIRENYRRKSQEDDFQSCVSIEDVAPPKVEHDLDDEHSRQDGARIANGLLSQLNERERAIVRETVMGDGRLKDVGKTFGVSKERVRQIRDAAVERMVHHAKANGIAI